MGSSAILVGVNHSFCEVAAAAGRESRHGDASIKGHVDVPLVSHVCHLLLRKQ